MQRMPGVVQDGFVDLSSKSSPHSSPSPITYVYYRSNETRVIPRRRSPPCGCNDEMIGRTVMLRLLIVLLLLCWVPSLQTRATPSCDRRTAETFIKKLVRMDIISQIERGVSVPKIYVRQRWYGLNLDEKKTFDGVIQCYLAKGKGKRVLAIYRDSTTGMDIARSSTYGFEWILPDRAPTGLK